MRQKTNQLSKNYINKPMHTAYMHKSRSYMERIIGLLVMIVVASSCGNTEPPLREKDGFIMVEAENFESPDTSDVRRWYVIDSTFSKNIQGFNNNYYSSSSKGKYIMLLPDTRVTHDDTLVAGLNFSNEPGKIAIIDYPIYFENPGKYYVWVSAYSSGTEDNGIHVGINGQWPESGARMQWCKNKNQWTWESKQRTDEQHCGVERQIYLDIPTKGLHTISFSMREDGFRFDRFALSKEYKKPEN
ncbi:MAG: hypothetical protein GVY19_08890 [Bacteroidetes bacterium]|jgi:hypothetical protein|nr:hypothetical protein [Bacteroidota bacterium]